MLLLCERIRELAALPILQTYYAADVESLEPSHGTGFLEYMQIVRDVAIRTSVPLIDHHQRWEPLRLRHPELYRALMLDALHVNALGNMVMGMDLVRALGVQLEAPACTFCIRGRWYQTVLDQLEPI